MTQETPIAAFKRLVDEYHAEQVVAAARVRRTVTIDDIEYDEPADDRQRPDFDTRDREGRDELPVLDGVILTDDEGGGL